MSWLCAEVFGWGRLDIERVETLIEEWNLKSVEQQFFEALKENPQQDIVGLLYSCLVSQANTILDKNVFRVFPNCIATQIVCRDEEYVKDFLEEADITETERDIVETACREAGIEVTDFSCFFQ
jgi:hypothetical protein